MFHGEFNSESRCCHFIPDEKEHFGIKDQLIGSNKTKGLRKTN
jgi:hypothetical protein